MRIAAVGLVLGVVAFGSGCAHEYMYVPVGPGATGGSAARYPIPPGTPQGEVYVTSFGFTDIDAQQGGGTMLHARLAVSNGSVLPWTVDGRQQLLLTNGQAPQAPAFLNTDAGPGPVYQVPAGRASVFDLYYAVPPPFDRAQNLGGFSLEWRVDAGGQLVAERTSFERFEGAPPPYAAYPPYVTVGLGFGVGWWYGPFYPFDRRFHPVIRHYYYPPARGGAGPWRGAPPSAWRGTAPGSSSWRGAPPAAGPSGGWRGSPAPRGGARGGGGWRGH